MRVRHYKGGEYEVVGVAQHTETAEALVVYRDRDGQLWARPAAMFSDVVLVDGHRVPRFTEIAAGTES